MAALSFEAAYRTLKRGEPAPVYYLTGQADVLKDELVTAILQASVDEGSRDFNLDVRSAGDIDGEALHALVETPPMLATRRAVVVKGLEQWRVNASVWKVLFKYLERPSPSTVLILVHGSGEKPNLQVAARAQHVEAGALSPEHLRRWLAARALKAGITVKPEAAEHLITAAGTDLASLAMELDKLAAAAPDDGAVTLELVSQLAGVRRGETLVDWVAAVLRRDPATAVGLLDIVLPQAGINGVRMVTALGTALVGTRLGRAMMDHGTPSAEIKGRLLGYLRNSRVQVVGQWDQEADRWARALAVWSAPELDDALAAVHETDRALKTSSVSDERGMLAGLLLRIARRLPARTGVAA